MRRRLKKETYDSLIKQNEVLNGLPSGSEEQLNACKAFNQTVEAYKKLDSVDINALIPGCVSIAMFILYMAFSDTHIMDTRPMVFCKGLFKK